MTPMLLALDPSITSTGWAVFDLRLRLPIAAGVIRTKAPGKEGKKRAIAAELAAERGVYIRVGVEEVIRAHGVVIAAQEGFGGGKNAGVAMALARAQQACVDGVHGSIGALPEFATQQAVKKVAVGSQKATKGEMEAAVRAHWDRADWGALLGKLPRGQHEHVFDACAVAWAVWERPAVAMLLQISMQARPRTGNIA